MRIKVLQIVYNGPSNEHFVQCSRLHLTSLTMAQQPEAGPSRRQTITKLKPPPPAPPATKPTPTLPTKILQGAGTRRNTERAGYPRNAMFITRKTSLGSLLARARGIILDEG